MRSASSGRVVPKTCKSWLCSACSPWLRLGAREYLKAGADLVREDQALTMLTLTDGAAGSLDFDGLSASWERTRVALRRRGLMEGYGKALELQPGRKALHAHVLVRAPGEWAARTLPLGKQLKRDRAQWAFHFNELVPMVTAHGWGKVCDWRRIPGADAAEIAGYVAKSLAGYATKESYAVLRPLAKARLRPIRASQGWVPGKGLRDFQTGSGVDPGPWEDVQEVRC